MKAKDFDKKFDQGKKDIIDDLDLSTARRANQDQKRINVDFPTWVVESLDREAARIGVTRQSIIKVWLVERLKVEAANKPLNGDAAGGSMLIDFQGNNKIEKDRCISCGYKVFAD